MEWEKLNGTYTWSEGMPGNSNQYVVIAPMCNETISFRVRMLNECGWSDWQVIEYEVTHCSSNCNTGGGGSGTIISDFFEIYPVPVDNTLHVILIGSNPGDLLLAGETLNIKFFNSAGVMVYNLNAIAEQNHIDVSDMSAGYYTLVITYNGTPESHQIIIN
ncbi:MAG: hypothetical protein CVU03_01560 [Bacteroidetes bacterium HGW-Bacteroidetes-2]|jgi:hypothetical protein|nr:MAG: hypothetical protein CVU03_01560 [Bacteroidetes bacterium HGW-Bacteroidetes-2]